MKKIGIIGGGFTGTMTAAHLIEQCTAPIEIILINERESLNRGIAYNPYSDKHLLNVMAAKMSAYAGNSDHFLDWVMQRFSFKHKDRTLIAQSFLPRRLYGDYLCAVWKKAEKLATAKHVKLTVIDSYVIDLDLNGIEVNLWLENNQRLSLNECIVATGNHVPRNPKIRNMDFYRSSNYFQNPWKAESVKKASRLPAVLIIGNGLTMVDTVLGLIEQGFKGRVYSISPNGFNILPHRHNGLHYAKLTEELRHDLSLLELVKLVNRHIKTVREFGVSAEPVIDSLRPHTQKIWKQLSANEKERFMSRLRHLWGVARHRIPLHTHDKIQQLRVDGKLHIHSGKLLDLREENNQVVVEYFDKKESETKTLKVSRVINCTGPETDLMKLEKSFLKNCLLKGILEQDDLKLGIRTDTETFRAFGPGGKQHRQLYVIGSNLKGELWESTAVNELRSQAEKLAGKLLADQGMFENKVNVAEVKTKV